MAASSNTIGSVAYEAERLLAKLAEDRVLYEGLRALLWRRREARREQYEAADGEKAIIMRGRCQELTSIINDVFPLRQRKEE